MVVFRSIAFVCALVMTAGACSGPTEVATSLAPTVVSATRDQAGIISFEVDWRNVGTVPMYVPSCDRQASMWLERRELTGWANFGGGVCRANLNQASIPIQPNESIRATVHVGPGTAGEYRAVTSASESPSENGELVRSEAARVQ